MAHISAGEIEVVLRDKLHATTAGTILGWAQAAEAVRVLVSTEIDKLEQENFRLREYGHMA